MGYEFWPEALEQTIRYAAARAKVPVYVTENGIGTEDDTRRVEYIRRALAGVQKCLNDGIDVRGYVHWSLMDNFEWIFGYQPEIRHRGGEPRHAGAHGQAERHGCSARSPDAMRCDADQ